MNKYFIIVFVFMSLISCKKKGKQQLGPPPPVPVSVYKVKIESVVGKDRYPASVVSLQQVELRAQVAGYVTKIFIKDGQKVKKGQKLYEIDRRKYNAAFLQAKANLQGANANLERAKKDLQRYENLLKKEAVAKQQVDYARANYKSALSQVTASQELLKSAAADLEYSVLISPLNGTIGISQVRVGAQVSPGATLLNTLSTDDPTGVDFVISENDISRFQQLFKDSTHNDSTFTLELLGGKIYPFKGKMVAIDRAVGRQSGTITVRLKYSNPKRELIAGMTVNVIILNQDVGEKVAIPYKAVIEQMSEYFVYVLKGDSVSQQRVNLGTRYKDMVVVRQGLDEGQNIVLDGVQRLRPGSKVQIGPPKQSNMPPGAKNNMPK